MTRLFTEGEGGFDEVITSNLFEDFMFVFDRLKILLTAVLREVDDFQGINILSFLSSDQIHFSKGSGS
jgi:hypothetical protein